MRPARLQVARQPDAPLTTPPGDQRVDRPQVRVGEFAHARGQQPPAENPPPHRRGLGRKDTDIQSFGAARAGEDQVRHCVQRLAVLTQLRGRAGECAGDPAVEDVFQQRQDFGAQPDAGEARLGVVRVVPGLDAEFGAGGPGGRARHGEQRAAPRRVVRPHPGDAARAGAAAEPEQDRFGLVVEGVAEQDEVVAGQRAVAGVARGGFRAAGAGDVGPAHFGFVGAEGLRGRGGVPRDLRRALLQAVVDDQRADAVAAAVPDVRRGLGEREGVGAAGDATHSSGGASTRPRNSRTARRTAATAGPVIRAGAGPTRPGRRSRRAKAGCSATARRR